MVTEVKEFDLKTCRFYGCDFDVHKDFYWDRDLKYSHALYLFTYHKCHTPYEAVPVVTSYRARVLESRQLRMNKRQLQEYAEASLDQVCKTVMESGLKICVVK